MCLYVLSSVLWCPLRLFVGGLMFYLRYLCLRIVVYNTYCAMFLFSLSSSCVPGARVAQWVRSLNLTVHTSISPIRRGFAPSFVNYKKGCTRLAATSDKVYQFLAQGRWFSPSTPASSTTKTGRNDIAEILLKVALNNNNSNSNYCVPYVASCSRLSIFDCPFSIL
jgi:hypothetical protein